jgi:PRC-barrel domain
MRTQVQLCIAAVLAVAAALFVAADRDRNAIGQETTIQNQTDVQLDAPRQTNQRQQPTADQSARSAPKFRASALIGMNVRGVSGDDDIGEIKDIAIGRDGRVAYVAVSFGGFLGLGDKLFAVPFEAVEFAREDPDDPNDDDHFARIAVTEDQLRNRQGFNEENWPEEADEGFLQSSPRRARQVERPAPRESDATR